MRRTLFLMTVASLLLLGRAGSATAWNRAGHMVSGAIAYDILQKERPEIILKVVALLKQHPDYESYWAGKLNGAPEELRDKYLFMLAARWADDVRDKPADHPLWHYINLPFKPAGQPASVHTKPRSEENILRAYREQNAKLSQEIPPADKAVALAWVFHLIGDAHQPLHTTTLFTTQWPDGDRGGNLFFVRVREDSAVINLHQLWDGLVLGSQAPTSVRNRATELLGRPEFARGRLAELQEKSFDRWVECESFELAKDVAYQEGQLAGKPEADGAPTLPDEYTRKAKAVADRRTVVAGYRLADLLKSKFE